MNDMTTIENKAKAASAEARAAGMNAEEAAYMRGGREPAAGSVPMSTSKYLNSPLYVHAYATMGLRRMGRDIAVTYDIPTMSRGIADVADHARYEQLIQEERAINPTFDAWMARRRPLNISPEAVAHCAEGTLGAALRDFMTQGYRIDFVRNGEARSDAEYLMKMSGHTHDLQHIVTGFGPNHAGELALAMMNITAAYKHFGPELAGAMVEAQQFVSWATLTRVSLHYREGMSIILEAARLGIAAGQSLKTQLFMVDWDDYYDWQLDDLATHLGIERGPGDAWTYTEDLCTG